MGMFDGIEFSPENLTAFREQVGPRMEEVLKRALKDYVKVMGHESLMKVVNKIRDEDAASDHDSQPVLGAEITPNQPTLQDSQDAEETWLCRRGSVYKQYDKTKPAILFVPERMQRQISLEHDPKSPIDNLLGHDIPKSVIDSIKKEHNIQTMDQMVSLTSAQLLAHKGMGRKGVWHIVNTLNYFGSKLKDGNENFRPAL
jgi:hypothetical protein